MAQGIVNLDANKHAVAGSTRLAATTATGGAGIVDIKLSADHDNGVIIGKGAAISGQVYAEAAATAFTGTILPEKAANGNYYVEVATAANAYLLLTTPTTYYEFSEVVKADSAFYNAKNEIGRAYPLVPGDVFELSAAGFSGTPAVGKSVTIDATTKQVKVVTA